MSPLNANPSAVKSTPLAIPKANERDVEFRTKFQMVSNKPRQKDKQLDQTKDGMELLTTDSTPRRDPLNQYEGSNS